MGIMSPFYLSSSAAANPISLAKLMINIKTLDAVTFVFFMPLLYQFLMA